MTSFEELKAFFPNSLKGDPNAKDTRKYKGTQCPKKAVHEIHEGYSPLPPVSKIPVTGTLYIPAVVQDGKEIKPDHTYEYEITNGDTLNINGYTVARAPFTHDNGRKFTPAQALTFCRAIVWQLLNDEGSLRDQVSQIGAPVQPAEPIAVDIPDYVGAYTQEAITGYPEDRYFVDLELSPAERADIMEMVRWDPFDDVHDNGYTRNQYDALDQSVQHETDRDIIAAFEPVKPAGWVPYLKLSIREFPIPGCSRAMTGLYDDTWVRSFVPEATKEIMQNAGTGISSRGQSPLTETPGVSG